MKAALEATLRTRAAHAARPVRVEEDGLPDATQRALEALGYLEPGDVGAD